MKLAEYNLNVTKYRNGDRIRYAQSEEEWVSAGKKGEGAYCLTETGSYLYNWYAVNDPRGLAPVGFRIPTEDEWKSVVDIESLRVYDGFRRYFGEFYNNVENALFWSSSECNPDSAWSRIVEPHNSDLGRCYYYKSNGLSVRCIKETSTVTDIGIESIIESLQETIDQREITDQREAGYIDGMCDALNLIKKFQKEER